MSAADVNCTGMADEICTLLQAGDSVRDPGAADVREGATSAVTSLSGAGREQGGGGLGAGVARRTVYYWIASGQFDRELDEAPVRYAARPPIARKIDPFRGVIDARLAEFPRLSAIRLFEEIRAAGYGGGYTQVKGYVRQVRPTPACNDPAVSAQVRLLMQRWPPAFSCQGLDVAGGGCEVGRQSWSSTG